MIAAAELQRAALGPEQVQEVVRLEQHVVELDERQALLPALLEALGGEHPVHGEVHANVAEELDVVQRREPVGVVDHQGAVEALELQEPAELFLLRFEVVVDLPL